MPSHSAGKYKRDVTGFGRVYHSEARKAFRDNISISIIIPRSSERGLDILIFCN